MNKNFIAKELVSIAKEIMGSEFEAQHILNFLKLIERDGKLISERASARVRGLTHEMSSKDKSVLDKYDHDCFDEVVRINIALDELITRMDNV